MGVEIAAWRGGRNLVTTCEGMPRLWLNSAGDVCDMLGQQVTTEQDDVQEVGDLLLFVAEWLFCIAQSDAPVRYGDIHPDIRASLYDFIPSAIALSDEDEVAFILS
jgi:hypothetical protein